MYHIALKLDPKIKVFGPKISFVGRTVLEITKCWKSLPTTIRAIFVRFYYQSLLNNKLRATRHRTAVVFVVCQFNLGNAQKLLVCR
jgi:hypothetical protein